MGGRKTAEKYKRESKNRGEKQRVRDRKTQQRETKKNTREAE